MICQPPEKHGGRHRTVDIREVVNATFYVLRTGCAWRLLPHDFPPWQTVYGYFRDWRKTGVWKQLNAALRDAVREQEEREAKPSAAIMDSQPVKTTAIAGERGYDAAKKVTGRKRHILVDVLGLLLKVLVTKANVPSAKQEDLVELLGQRLFEHGVNILGSANDVLVNTRGCEDTAVKRSEQGDMQQDSEKAREEPHSKIVVAVIMAIGFQR